MLKEKKKKKMGFGVLCVSHTKFDKRCIGTVSGRMIISDQLSNTAI